MSHFDTSGHGKFLSSATNILSALRLLLPYHSALQASPNFASKYACKTVNESINIIEQQKKTFDYQAHTWLVGNERQVAWLDQEKYT